MILLGKILDEPCTVNRIMYQGMSKDLTAFWSVGCTNGRSYQIGISADQKGSARCADCAVLKLVGVNCFEKFKNP
jgi:hypothetical protein